MRETVRTTSRLSQDSDDRELILRVACSSDREAFKRLFLRFGPKVKALMIKSGAEIDAAEDLAQDVMLILWRKARLYDPDKGSVATWVFTIARNLRIDRIRRQSPKVYEDIEDAGLEAPDATGEEELHRTQRQRLVSQALTELPADQQRVIELSFVHDVTQAGIAQQIGVPLGTVKSRMRLAYLKLRERLEELQ